MHRQNNKDTKQNTKAVNWWIDKTIKIPNRIPKLSIDGPTKQWRYQTGSQSCQLMDRQNNKDTKQDTKVVNWWTDKAMKIPNRIPKLSINGLTKQWRYQTEYQRCQLMNRQNNKDTKQDPKGVNWWTDKTIKIPNRIPKVSIDGPTKQ
jgi:uncharacterized alpha/beta hydrolase family protein